MFHQISMPSTQRASVFIIISYHFIKKSSSHFFIWCVQAILFLFTLHNLKDGTGSDGLESCHVSKNPNFNKFTNKGSWGHFSRLWLRAFSIFWTTMRTQTKRKFYFFPHIFKESILFNFRFKFPLMSPLVLCHSVTIFCHGI